MKGLDCLLWLWPQVQHKPFFLHGGWVDRDSRPGPVQRAGTVRFTVLCAVSHVCPRASATPDLPSRSPSPTLAPPSCRLAVVHSLRSPSCRAPPLPLSVRVANSFSPHSQYASCGAVDRWRSPRERAHWLCVCAPVPTPPPPPCGHSAPPLAAPQRAPTLARTAKHAHWPSPSTPKLRRAETPLQLSAPVDRARARSARGPAPQAGHSRLTRTVTLLAGALGAHQAPPRCLAQIGDDRALTSGKRLQSPRRPRRRRRRPSQVGSSLRRRLPRRWEMRDGP